MNAKDTAAGGTKNCPFCAQLSTADSVKCPHCGTDLTEASPRLDDLPPHGENGIGLPKHWAKLGPIDWCVYLSLTTPATVPEIAERAGVEPRNVPTHITALAVAGLIVSSGWPPTHQRKVELSAPHLKSAKRIAENATVSPPSAPGSRPTGESYARIGSEDHPATGALAILGVALGVGGMMVGFALTWWLGAPLMSVGALLIIGLFLAAIEPSPTTNNANPKWTPPPGTAVPPGARFMRLTQHRARGLSGMKQSTDVICGRCGWSYTLPSWVIKNFRYETTWGASARRLGQPEVAMNQRQATDAMRCPRCGSIDPGIWVMA